MTDNEKRAHDLTMVMLAQAVQAQLQASKPPFAIVNYKALYDQCYDKATHIVEEKFPG